MKKDRGSRIAGDHWGIGGRPKVGESFLDPKQRRKRERRGGSLYSLWLVERVKKRVDCVKKTEAREEAHEYGVSCEELNSSQGCLRDGT